MASLQSSSKKQIVWSQLFVHKKSILTLTVDLSMISSSFFYKDQIV